MAQLHKTNVAQLERTFGNLLVKDRIQTFYAKLGHELRELEKWKIKNDYCTRGISCMHKAILGKSGKGRGCAHHVAAMKAGIKLRKWTAYDTEYGILRAKEKLDALTKKKSVTKKRAA